jgi:hypothetical protein
MCDTCGCDHNHEPVKYTIPGHDHAHEHNHTHDHDHDHIGHVHGEHEHTHAHTHSHGHSHPHDHDHDHTHEGDHVHEHTHQHSHSHSHNQDHSHSKVVQLEQDVLSKNNCWQSGTEVFLRRNVFFAKPCQLSWIRKTTLLEKTIAAMKNELNSL